jgi:hypothetical protein
VLCLRGPYHYQQFQKLVTDRVAAGNPGREDSPAYLLKRLKQLEHENASLRQKKRRRVGAAAKGPAERASRLELGANDDERARRRG